MAGILVIDDEQAIRLVIRRRLASAGHDVVEAFDGKDGLEALRQEPVDLVTTDLQIPRKGGDVARMLVIDDDAPARISPGRERSSGSTTTGD